jgi:hypothetical protein
MTEIEPISICTSPERPRHGHQEIADLLTAALLRLRVRQSRDIPQNSEHVCLGLSNSVEN